MNAHRGGGSGPKTPFGVKVITAFLVTVLLVIVAYAFGRH